MARIATLSGTFLVPGVSKNGRKYTAENIGHAVRGMKARLAAGDPIPMHTSHKANAEGQTRETAAHVISVEQHPDGSAHFEAHVLDTEAGKDVKSLTVPDKAGRRALKTVSIFGKWDGTPTRDEDGHETAPGLTVHSIDFTHRPGIAGAQIDDARLAEMALAGYIAESIEEVAFVDDIVSESTEEKPSALALLEAELSHVFEDGHCATCVAEAKAETPGGSYADPGYQADKVKRYPCDTAKHTRAAWSYVNMPKNAAKYTAAQLRRVKAKIKTAAKKFGIDIAAESAVLDGLLESLGTEFADVLEAYASTSFDNGQGSINVSAYTDEPADLPKVGLAVARAALAGLLKLDPDNDGDVDIAPTADANHAAPPGDEDDNDMECTACGASGPSDAMFCPQCGQPVPGAETAPADQESEAIVPESVTPAAEAAKTVTLSEDALAKLVSEAVAKAVAAPAVPVESELEKARRIVAEADAAEAAKPITAADVAKLLTEATEAATAKIREEAIETIRRGSIGRRGLVETADAIAAADFERDPQKLAALPKDDFQAVLAASLGNV